MTSGQGLHAGAQRESPASHKDTRRDVIDAIEFAGTNTARARVRCSIGPRDYVDFLTLVRVQNRWQIIAKVFHFIELNKEQSCRTSTSS